MAHFVGSCSTRFAGFLLVCASMLAAPWAQAQSWSPTVGGAFQGGYVRGLMVPSLFNATSTGDSWAAVDYGGMFKQVAGSSTWTPINTGLTDKRAYTFAVDTGVSPYRGYVATRGGGVYKTVDGGANWTPVNNGLGCVYLIGLQAFFGATASTDRIFASTSCGANSGVYLSTDGGATWTLTSGMSPSVAAIGTTRVNPAGSGVDFMLASTYDGIYKSTDQGLTWTLANGNITNPNGPAPNINNVTYLYNGSPAALTLYAAEVNTGVWKSSDQGATWTLVLNKLTTSAGIGTDGFANGNLYYPVDGEGVYRSIDQGATWSLFVSNSVLPGARSIQRNTTVVGSPIYYAQTYAGIFHSADGGVTWNKASTGLPGGYVINGNYDSAGNGYVAAGEGVYKAPPGSGGTFQRLAGYNLGYFISGGHVIVVGDVPYAITYNLGVFKYDGTNWVAKNTGLPTMTRQGGQLRGDPNNPTGLYLGLNTGGVYYSADGGNTWTAKSAGLTGAALNIRHMAVSPAYVLIATANGVYKSTDTGATWTRVAFPAKSPANVELPIDHMRMDGGNGNIYAAVYQTDSAGVTYPGSGLWKSTDGGASWTQSLAGKQVHEIGVARTGSGVTLYAGVWDAVGGGAMQSTDEAATWTAINTGLTNNYIGNFAIQAGVLKGVTTYGDGVLRYTPPTPAASLGIVPGWNLLGNGMSTPLTVATAFGDTNNVITVWKWLPGTANWAFYTPTQSDGGAAYAAGKGYSFLTTINGGEGFWVNAKSAFSVALSGNPVPTSNFADGLTGNMLPSGWSLIAIGDNRAPGDFATSIATTPPATGQVATSVTSLWAWNAASPGWYFYAPSLVNAGTQASYISSKGYLDFATASKLLDPATGFWVNHP